ncbi:hypothetical protein [Desulfoscipio gibsoniae]
MITIETLYKKGSTVAKQQALGLFCKYEGFFPKTMQTVNNAVF